MVIPDPEVNDEKAEIEEKTTGEVQPFSATQKISVYVRENKILLCPGRVVVHNKWTFG